MKTLIMEISYNNFINYYRKGTKFTPKKSQLVKNAEILNTKRDMRKKLVKSNMPWSTVKNKVIKKQFGGFLNYEPNVYNDTTSIDEIKLEDIGFDPEDFSPYDLKDVPTLRDNFVELTQEDLEKEYKDESENVTENHLKEDSEIVYPKINFNPGSSTSSSLDGSSKEEMDPKYGLMGEFIKIARRSKLPFRITSGYRPGATTSNGSPSWHGKGLALDIVPEYGVTWNTFIDKFKNSPELLMWMKNNEFGVLDETSPEMLAKTGGTGAHWHIGKDKAAINTFNKWFPNLTLFKPQEYKKFAETLYPIYEEVLTELNLPKYNIDNLIKQDALESGYGTLTRGNGFNLGGIKVFKNKEILGTRHTDKNYYRNFKNLKDYITYKVKLLHNDYGAITANPKDFIEIIHGRNPKHKVYSESKDKYLEDFPNMTTLAKYLPKNRYVF